MTEARGTLNRKDAMCITIGYIYSFIFRCSNRHKNFRTKKNVVPIQ